jgi:hypothetical protein
MKNDVACCGYKCKICPAYKDNITGPAYQQKVSDGWFKYYGFRIPHEKIYCDDCLPENSDKPSRRIDNQCPVRPCVLAKGLPNCAYCDEYVCNKLSQRIVNLKEVADKQEKPVSQEEYNRYLKPYDNKTTLDNIRKELGKNASK